MSARAGIGGRAVRRAGLLALAVALVGPGSSGLVPPLSEDRFGLAAQEAEEFSEALPLTKSDLTRLVVGTTYAPDEVVRIVRRTCLSFVPTERDLQGLRRLGATQPVLDAVRECAERPPLTARLTRSQVDATTGNVVRVEVEILRGEQPASGVPVVLAGSGTIPGGPGADARAVTDQDGRAVFRLPAGSQPNRYALRLATPGGRLEGQTGMVLAVRAPPPPPAEEEAPAQVAAETAEQPSPTAGSGDATQGQGSPASTAGSGEEADAETLEEELPELPAPSRRTEVSGLAAGDDTASAILATSLARGAETRDTEAAVRWYEVAVERNPEDAEAWLAYGRVLAAADRTEEARAAFQRAIDLDPALAQRAEAEMEVLPTLPPRVELSIWGGASFEATDAAELLSAEVAVRVLPELRVWARYDGGLGLELPALIRGRGDPRTVAAGGAVDWGPEHRLRTLAEVGRGEGGVGLLEYTYRLEQRVQLTDNPDDPTLDAGLFFGRWYDRDDWLIYSRLHIPVAPDLAVRPGLSFGETVGTAFAELGRRPASEVRAELGVDLRPRPELLISPVIGYGWVDDAGALEEEEEENGASLPTGTALQAAAQEEESGSSSLTELRLRVEAELDYGLRLLAFLRHQRPALSEPFTSVAAGFHLGLDPLR